LSYRLFFCAVLAAQFATAQEVPRDILLLLPWELSRPSSVEIIEGLTRGLAQRMPGQTIVVPEFSTASPDEPTWFEVKHGRRKFALIVAVSDPVYLRALRYRERLWPGTPIIVFTNPRFGQPPPPTAPGVIVLDVSSSPLESARAARRMLPATQRFLIVSGTNPSDRWISQTFVRELRAAMPDREVIEWTASSLAALRESARRLPPDSVILLGMFAYNVDGLPVTRGSLASTLARVTQTPMFDWASSGLGSGAVGGYLANLEVPGEESAALAQRLFAGESAAAIGAQRSQLNSFVFDGRQLRRLGIPEQLLPPNSKIQFRSPTIWESYSSLILTGLLALTLLTGLVIFLLVERRRRQRSQADLRERLDFEALAVETSAHLHEGSPEAGLAKSIEKALARLCSVLSAEAASFAADRGFLAVWPPAANLPEPCLRIPLRLGGDTHGYLVIHSALSTDWPTERWLAWEPRLRTFGEMMLSALSRREADLAAARSRELNQAMLDSVEGFLVTIDASATVIFINLGWRFLADHRALPIFEPGASYLAAWQAHTSAPPELVAELQAAFADGRRHFHSEFLSPARRWFRLEAEPLDRAAGGWMITHRDITAQKQDELERATLVSDLAHRDRVSSLSELASSIAHEINQPLTAIVSNGESARELLRSAEPDLRELREIIHDVVDDGRRAANVVGQMRAMLKKGSSAAAAPVTLCHLARETLRLVEADAAARGVRLTADFAGDVEVMADAVQLQQVVLNLVTNAFDSVMPLPAAERAVHLRSFRTAAGGRLEVDDGGPGVPVTHRELIFQQFYSTKPEGLGIGLSISRTLLAAMDGRIGVESAPGGGARFWVELTGVQPMQKVNQARSGGHA
jgi:two-component system, LuxR family, sensor kinase FixL